MDKTTPVRQPQFGENGAFVGTTANGFQLFSYTFTVGSKMVSVTVQGKAPHVSGAMAEQLAHDAFTNEGGATLAQTSPTAAPAGGKTGPMQIVWGDTAKLVASNPAPDCGGTVGADGTFEVRVVTHKCFTHSRQGAALVSVGSNTNVLPSLGATVG